MPKPKEAIKSQGAPRAGQGGGEGEDEAVVLSVRMTRKQLELLDVLAELYGRTKTDIAREGILEIAGKLASREVLEDQAEQYKRKLMDQYDRVSSKLDELSPA